MKELFQSPCNFLGLPEEAASKARARAWILPVPYEGTTSYGAGTREGPAALISASRQAELYDTEFGCEPAMEYGIHTMNPLAPVHRSPDDMVQAVEEAVTAILSGTPRPEVLALVGGEHTISAGVVRGLARVTPKGSLVAVQIDAHADLREEYQSSRFSHACAARRIVDVCPLFQIGVRSLSAEEAAFLKETRKVTTVFAEQVMDSRGDFLEELANFVDGKHVFLTVDCDAFDPGIMPAVGTPEPGGLSWERALEIARAVCRDAMSVPAFDVVELAPIPGFRAPDFLAAKLVYKLVSYALLGVPSGE